MRPIYIGTRLGISETIMNASALLMYRQIGLNRPVCTVNTVSTFAEFLIS